MAVTSKRATIEEEYWQRFPTSAELFARAKAAIPSGVTHDARSFAPFPVYMSRAEGAYKWDADGNKLLDHWMGHGALLLGHNHPTVTRAVSEALARGTHLGACTEDEVEWAELVRKLIPSAEEVRFTMSGTESTMLALRDARAYTGKPKVIRFQGNFHGWHDYAMVGYQPPFDTPTSAGVPSEVLGTMVTLPPADIRAVKQALDTDELIGTVILEPAGGSNGIIPPDIEFLHELRELTAQRGVVLIFDEVITGFRYSPGGAQQYYGITPDITTMAKIVAEGEANEYSNRMGKILRDGMNETLRRRGAPGVVYGECSIFHVMLGEGMAEAVAQRDVARLMGARGAAAPLRKAMLLEGVDFMRTGGFTSIVHGDEEIKLTLGAFDRAIERLQSEGVI